MRKEFDKNIKEKAIEMPKIGNNGNDIVNELGINRTMHCRWREQFKDHEFEHSFGLGNPKIKDLKHENICLRKMIKDAKKEQALLKKAINSLIV